MKRILIIGAGDAGRIIHKEIISNKEIRQKYQIIGFLDDDLNKKKVGDYSVIGVIDDAKDIILREKIDEVIIAIPSANSNTINHIITKISNCNVNIKIIPGIYEIIEGTFSINQVRDIEPADLLGREEVGFEIGKFSGYFKNKTVFVTGAGGSIGSEIFFQLLKLPIKRIIAFGHGENSVHNLICKMEKDKRFEYIIGDIKDYAKINHEIKKHEVDIIFHAAAHKHLNLMEKYPDEAIKNNILGTYNCAKAAIENKVKKFVLISTDKAVNPTSVMGATKKISEKIVLSLNRSQDDTRFVITRFGNVLGSRGSVVTIFKDQIKKGGPVTVTDSEITRYFMSISEAAKLVIKSSSIEHGDIFILNMGKPIKILDFARRMIDIYNQSDKEIPIIFTGLRTGEKLFEELYTDNEKIEDSMYNKIFICHENERILSPGDLDKLIEDFICASNIFNNKDIKDLLNKYVPEYDTDAR